MRIILGQQDISMMKHMKGVIHSISPNADVIECYTWDCTLLDLIKEGSSDYLILDLNILGTSWVERANDLMELLGKKTKFIITGESVSPDTLLQYFEKGVVGFIPHDDIRTRLKSVLDFIFAGGIFVPYIFVKKRSDFAPEEMPKYHLPNGQVITKRQMQVLILLKEGYSNKQISQKMDVREPTIKLHIHNLFQKLDATNRTQIVIKAHQLGLF